MGIFDKKPESDFSDVQSGSSSTASAGTTYTVKSGDSLSKIAKHSMATEVSGR